MNQRLMLPYRILQFDANNIEVGVDNPQGKTIWMFYSDVWHPDWKAKVNDQPTPVYKANLAYKAVALPPGYNRVHFRFHSQFLSFLFSLVGLNSLFWVVFVLCLVWRIVFNFAKE